MFTSRAEHRLLLREDNADTRLTPIGRQLGLVGDERWAFHERKHAAIDRELQRLEGRRISASTPWGRTGASGCWAARRWRAT